MALSSSGNTAIVGGPADDVRIGAVWVFTRSGSTWSPQGEKLLGPEETGEGEFGSSVSLSAAGTSAVIGGYGDNGRLGAAWGFAFSGGKWTAQGQKLTGGGESGNGEFGESVALSANGETALIGGPADGSFSGAVWAFAFSGGKWNQQGGKLTGGAEIGAGELRLEFGPRLRRGNGADRRSHRQRWGGRRVGVHAFGRHWSEHEKITGTGESGKGAFGWSVAVSAEGTDALVGGPEDNAKAGAAWVFVESAGKWSQQGEKLTGTGESGAGELGFSVALGAEARNGAGRRLRRQRQGGCRMGLHPDRG